MPSSLLVVLTCPLCNVPNSLVNPTTLRCGHSFCESHLSTYPLCPLPTCTSSLPISSSSTLTTFNIPSTSAVVLVQPTQPPEDDDDESGTSHIPTEPRVDVTLNKISSLVQRALSEDDSEHLAQPNALNADNTTDNESSASNSEPRSGASSPSRARSRSHSREPSQSSPSRRPRKRRRCHTPSQPTDEEEPDLLAHLRRQSTIQRSVRRDQPLITDTPSLSHFRKELLAELTCEICFNLFFQPMTTPCQHTFCTKCIQRSQDHSRLCPLCRHQLPGYSYFQDHPYNQVVLALILKTFPSIYHERAAAIEAEERDARLDTPIFVCMLSFPGIPTTLHFYEPRYRLMLRRCLESPSPCFGMVMSPKPGAGSTDSDYGTMLEIQSVKMLADGRSIVKALGRNRFRILELGILDGYKVGRIERIEDFPDDFAETLYSLEMEGSQDAASESAIAPEPSNEAENQRASPAPDPPPVRPPIRRALTSPEISSAPLSPRSRSQTSVPLRPFVTNAQLMADCRKFLDRFEQGAAPWVVQRLHNRFGLMPTDPTLFSFWVALVLPIEDQERAKLLPIRSTRLRLLLVCHWIEQLNNQWYASTSVRRLSYIAWAWLHRIGVARWAPLGLGMALGLGLAQVLVGADNTAASATVAIVVTAMSLGQEPVALAGLVLVVWMLIGFS